MLLIHILKLKQVAFTEAGTQRHSKYGVLKTFVKFAGKHPYQILILIKLEEASDFNSIKKEIVAQVLSCGF